MHTAQSLILDKMTGLCTARHSGVVEHLIFYNLKKWKTILGLQQHSYKLPNPTHTGHIQRTPTQINIFLYKFLLNQLLLTIIPINNLMYIISTYLYFSNINLLNYVINKKIDFK